MIQTKFTLQKARTFSSTKNTSQKPMGIIHFILYKKLIFNRIYEWDSKQNDNCSYTLEMHQRTVDGDLNNFNNTSEPSATF